LIVIGAPTRQTSRHALIVGTEKARIDAIACIEIAAGHSLITEVLIYGNEEEN
jgi:hypothetical protein